MTIYQIKYETMETAPYFFCSKTLRFFGQTMRSFSVKKQPDGRIKISAPMMDGSIKRGETVRYYNPKTKELDHN